jgi:hypothetical protein
MVDRVMEAAASDPVFGSACFELRCGSCTAACKRKLWVIDVLTTGRQHKVLHMCSRSLPAL